jgi:hypothetical protein
MEQYLDPDFVHALLKTVIPEVLKLMRFHQTLQCENVSFTMIQLLLEHPVQAVPKVFNKFFPITIFFLVLIFKSRWFNFWLLNNCKVFSCLNWWQFFFMKTNYGWKNLLKTFGTPCTGWAKSLSETWSPITVAEVCANCLFFQLFSFSSLRHEV